jgi:hypothetical protein
MVFRRPELEKDNPPAIQPYVGPRRRRAGAHVPPAEESAQMSEMKGALHALTKAASRMVKGMPKAKGTARDLSTLRNAISQAERVLSV